MEDLIDDLRAALDQMNRNLKQIADNTDKTNELLQQLAAEKDDTQI